MLTLIFLSCFIFLNVSAIKLKPTWGKEADCIGDEVNGTCVEPHRCLSTNPYTTGLIYPKPCSLKSGGPGVCCTDCELVTNSSDAYLDPADGGFFWKTGEKSWDNHGEAKRNECLEYAQKIEHRCWATSWLRRTVTENKCHNYMPSGMAAVGGSDVFRGEFPHMALLGYQDTTSPSEWLCSGSLISDRFILTAAHCIASRVFGEVTEAAFGVLKRSDPDEHWHKYKIKRVIPHPEYRSPIKYHDIALLETEKPVVFIEYLILPACLPAREIKVNYDSTDSVTATGWGSLGYRRELADTMQKVSLVKFSDEECKEMYPVHRHLKKGLNTTTQMCYGDKFVIRDTCRGDSGGPLQLDTRHPTCMHIIIGVTSYGQECGFQGGAGIYTKVAKYLRWIESVVWP